ncbi:WcaF family extracellular polysaccharide biosynthesis acetyltransferase [Sulfuriferula sp.]|uniref:WcaF family extracellular polysaccharide biosynthesis acetyltransferase n=1 Tax=Sulfuriferula sp. TaxID=2025307 RepID=UPI0027322AE3|nr:WcaF family extracellular polysaccharide biosynthesis acetyltransferase [Sulfuriferula sp.]MDP2024895.1 WcaF family extracellular polysaccharide biosynthesis acetyltransferase [Sulfuriferula sp.]
MRLDQFNNAGYQRGRSSLVEAAWLVVQALLVRSFIPGSFHRRILLRMFGARIGTGVVIKPGVRVKFPWRLDVGAHSWIGEGVWIDNLADVKIGAHCCLSQDAYLCTGSHDWSKTTFDLVIAPIVIGEGAWIAARAVIAPGVFVGRGAVLGLSSLATVSLQENGIYQGVPAKLVRHRVVATGEPDQSTR